MGLTCSRSFPRRVASKRGFALVTTKKTYFSIPGSSTNFVITDVIFYVFPSSFLHSMEKMSQFLIFLSILSYI